VEFIRSIPAYVSAFYIVAPLLFMVTSVVIGNILTVIMLPIDDRTHRQHSWNRVYYYLELCDRWNKIPHGISGFIAVTITIRILQLEIGYNELWYIGWVVQTVCIWFISSIAIGMYLSPVTVWGSGYGFIPRWRWMETKLPRNVLDFGPFVAVLVVMYPIYRLAGWL
jgi:hypothetical protein